MGFYAHHPNMVGGIPEVMTKTIDDHVTHSYYLLFGREMDREGRIKKIWIEVELPSTAQFCYWEDGTFSHLKFMVDIRANAAKGLSITDRNVIFDAMESGISYMADRVAQLVECCGSTLRQQCECGWSFGDVRDFTNTGGFFNISASVLPVESTQDTACICWNAIPQNQTIHHLDSGMVYVSANIDDIIITDEFQFELSELYSILIDIGVRTNERRQTFFGAITDQYIFCEDDSPPPVTVRTTAMNLTNIQEELAAAQIGIWFNVLHFNGTATVSMLAQGLNKEELASIFSSVCLDRESFAQCAFTRLAYYHHNEPSKMPSEFPGLIENLHPLCMYSLFNHHRRTNFNATYLQWFVDISLTIQNDTSEQETELAEIHDVEVFDQPYISDENPACPELFVYRKIDIYPNIHQSFATVVKNISIEFPFPEHLDGSKIYVGRFWLFMSHRRALFPSNPEQNLGYYTALAINNMRNNVVNHVVETEGEFPAYRHIIDDEPILIIPTIWENTHLWGHSIVPMIHNEFTRNVNEFWLNFRQPSITLRIERNETNPAFDTYKDDNLFTMDFFQNFPVICHN